jgi:hypothetical protein
MLISKHRIVNIVADDTFVNLNICPYPLTPAASVSGTNRPVMNSSIQNVTSILKNESRYNTSHLLISAHTVEKV